MKKVLLEIAVKHLLFRKRQTIVSLMGIILGVAFFISISSLMVGSQNDFMKRLVDNSPHITIRDQFREPRVQPVQKVYKDKVVEVSGVTPLAENRGIRYYYKTLEYLKSFDGVEATPVMVGQTIVNYGGKDFALTVNGIIPQEMRIATTVYNYMISGNADNLIGNKDGILIGSELARKLSIHVGSTISISSSNNQAKNFRVVGIFKTGRQSFDDGQAFADMKQVQALLGVTDRVNTILLKLSDPYMARDFASDIEKRIKYQSISWQESSEDLMNTIAIRNTIMFTVVSAVLIVAAFGIYNVISTIVMEKHRDIAILKSMGFYASDIQIIFVTQGIVMGIIGSFFGLLLGMCIMKGLGQIYFKPPGSSSYVNMPIDWGLSQFLIATAFAMVSSIGAAFLPARKGSMVQPVDILRGGAV